MKRLFDLTIVALWLASLAGLVWHDLVPTWTAGEAPISVPMGGSDRPVQMQFSIETDRHGLMGYSWADFRQLDTHAIASSVTLLEGGPLPGPVRVETELGYDERKQLDDLRILVFGLPLRISVEAENFGKDFPCIIMVGDQRYTFTLRNEMAAAFAEVFRPFVYLRGLYVGQTWRIASINPLGTLWGQAPDPTPIVAKVTGRETIEHNGQRVECFRVEAQNTVAWVDDQGRVLLQVVDAPVLGKIRIRLMEGYSEEALQRARERVSRWQLRPEQKD